ncbi:MAG: hypothetical protein AAFW75_06795 [Cyanobacteria bacterium J06636_16]
MTLSKPSTRLSRNPLDRLGDLNPQLLRELKGRSKKIPVILAIALSLLLQLVMVVSFSLALPGSVQSHDLKLDTYPQVYWDRLSQLRPPTQHEILPEDPPTRRDLRHSWVYVKRIKTQEPVRGDKATDPALANEVQVGDRLIAIDGQMVNLEELQKVEASHDLLDLLNYADRQITANRSQLYLPEIENLVGSSVELTLYRRGQGEFTVQLPRIALSTKRNKYCLANKRGICDVAADKQSYQVDWATWYGDLFPLLLIPIVFPLMGIGTFMLASNVAEEKRRGTLNFLQLTPRSPLSILSGKLLGVPICLYLAIGLMLPLHWWTGLNADYGVGYLLGFDLTLIGQTLIFYLLALLLALSVSSPMLLRLQPWLLAGGVLLFQIIAAFIADDYVDFWWRGADESQSSSLQWSLLFSPVTSLLHFEYSFPMSPETGSDLYLGIFKVNFAEYTILALAHACGWCVLLWHGIQRRFRAPNATVLKRQLSYLVSLAFVAMVSCFSYTRVPTGVIGPTEALTIKHILSFTPFLGVLYFVVLAIALTPSKQSLTDWSRFRQVAGKKRLPLWQDLLIGDTSSPVLALGLNLVLVSLLFGLWVAWHQSENIEMFPFFVTRVLFLAGVLLLGTLMSQALLLSPWRKNGFWFTTLSCGSGLIFPSVSWAMAGLLGSQKGQFLGMPSEVAVIAIPLSLLWMAIAVMTVVHIRQLRLVGRSDSQILLQKASVSK